MAFNQTMSILLTLAVLFAYLNYRFIKMPTTIAIMSSSLVLSFLLIIVGQFGFATIEQSIANALTTINFRALLMQGMLGFLLFAGALNIDLNDLRERRWEIAILATGGTIASAFLIGTFCYYLLQLVHIQLSFIYCLLFGALISPTDPIAVLAILKSLNAPSDLKIFLEGESLFNDGVGIVIFLTILDIASSGGNLSWHSISLLFIRQAFGGILYGALIGLLAYKMIKPIDSYKLAILITLTVATGGYTLAETLGVSGPLAMVAAGIFVGNSGKKFAMAKDLRDNLHVFWEVIDEILNAMLFLLMGFELLVIQLHESEFIAGLLMIPAVLLARFLCVIAPMGFFKHKHPYPHMTKLMVWGGLRGGLAVALALAIPPGEDRELILTMTYVVVVFSIVVQGLTMKPLIRLSLGRD